MALDYLVKFLRYNIFRITGEWRSEAVDIKNTKSLLGTEFRANPQKRKK